MVVNNHAQYCSVVKTGIGKVKMIIGGEVDAGKRKTAMFFRPLMPSQFGTIGPMTGMSPPTGSS